MVKSLAPAWTVVRQGGLPVVRRDGTPLGEFRHRRLYTPRPNVRSRRGPRRRGMGPTCDRGPWMRCAELAQTWDDLRTRLDAAGVLVLPALEGTGPTVRLDADVDQNRPATPDEVALAVGRLTAV